MRRSMPELLDGETMTSTLEGLGQPSNAPTARIVTASPVGLDLGPKTVPILPNWVLGGSPVTRTKSVVRSRDWTSNVVVWECTAGRFRWRYDKEEVVFIVAGEVFITDDLGEERWLRPGDVAIFPSGTSSVWHVPSHVRKIAVVRETVWGPLGFCLKAWKTLLRRAGIGGPSPL
jgi:uncharacterized cupin superfamily protein